MPAQIGNHRSRGHEAHYMEIIPFAYGDEKTTFFTMKKPVNHPLPSAINAEVLHATHESKAAPLMFASADPAMVLAVLRGMLTWLRDIKPAPASKSGCSMGAKAHQIMPKTIPDTKHRKPRQLLRMALRRMGATPSSLRRGISRPIIETRGRSHPTEQVSES